MGVYPRTPRGATRVLADAARLAVQTGASRLIVKTVSEAHRIPAIADNVAALEAAGAAAAAAAAAPAAAVAADDSGIYAEARAMIEAVASLRSDLGRALVEAFRLGYLDVPYCLHPDNANTARSYLDTTGRLRWSRLGAIPIRPVVRPARQAELTSAELLAALCYVERKFDNASLEECLAVPV